MTSFILNLIVATLSWIMGNLTALAYATCDHIEVVKLLLVLSVIFIPLLCWAANKKEDGESNER